MATDAVNAEQCSLVCAATGSQTCRGHVSCGTCIADRDGMMVVITRCSPLVLQALGSRAASYQLTHTIDTSSISTGPCQVFMRSITAMGAYQHMSAEELRWADYEAGFSGGIAAAPALPAPAATQQGLMLVH